MNQPEAGDYDLVAFFVKDFGEILIAGVRHIPENVLANLEQVDDQAILGNLAYKALSDWRDFPTRPNVVEEEYLNKMAPGL